MKRIACPRIVISLLCLCLLPVKSPAQVGSPTISNGDAALVVGVVAGVGAAIGIGVYYAFNHSRSIRGCVVTGSNGLELQNEGDRRTFLLQGITADVKSGNRVSLKGKKAKNAKDSSGNPTFLVEKLEEGFRSVQGRPGKPVASFNRCRIRQVAHRSCNNSPRRPSASEQERCPTPPYPPRRVLIQRGCVD